MNEKLDSTATIYSPMGVHILPVSNTISSAPGGQDTTPREQTIVALPAGEVLHFVYYFFF